MATLTRDRRRRDTEGDERKRRLMWVGIVLAVLVVAAVVGFFVLGGDADADVDVDVETPEVDVDGGEAPDVDIDDGGDADADADAGG